MNVDKMKRYAPTVVRVGIAAVVVWFGWSQVGDPEPWTQLIPESVMNISGLTALTLVKINGWAEIILGTALLFGIYTRIVGLLVALHIANVTYIVGYNAVGVRDFGLTLGALSTFLHGVSPLSIDAWRRKNQSQIPQI